jgi:Uncharacterized protein conserved in bacteria (DUF2330)
LRSPIILPRYCLVPGLAGLALTLALIPSSAPACAVPPLKSGKPVAIADETAIILWDAESSTEHFIRRASFMTEADDFGFLVPTPAQPQLAEASDDAFKHLQKLTEPAIKKVPRPSGGVSCGCGGSKTAKSEKSKVQVLEEVKGIAGYDAVVVRGDAADTLAAWLDRNGYSSSPALEAWLKPYVEKKWVVTAFKLTRDEDAKRRQKSASSAVRMSFQTETPFFPYSEPDNSAAEKQLNLSSRLLRVYFIADARFKGKLTKETAWPGKVVWTNKVTAGDRARTLELVKLKDGDRAGPVEWWLTEFEDRSAPRPGIADVTFSRDVDQSTITRDPIIEYVEANWPRDVTVYAIAAAMFLPFLRRRSKTK